MLQGPKTGEIAIKTGGIIPNLLPAKPRGKISVRNSAGGKISLQKNRLDFFFSLSLSSLFLERFFYAKDTNNTTWSRKTSLIGGRDTWKARVDNEWPSARQRQPLSSSESSISNGSIYVTGVIEFMPVKGGWRGLEMRTAECVHSVRVQHSLSACISPYDGSRCVPPSVIRPEHDF